MLRNDQSRWKSWSCYKPRHMKVYGCICISQDNKIALVKGSLSGKWSFPKGHMEPGDTAQSCALRELREETGIILSDNARFMGYRKLASGGYFVYEVPVEVPLVPQRKEEISECGWFDLNELRSLHVNVDVSNFRTLMR